MSLFNIHPLSRRAEVGYLLSPDYWQKGIMTEMLEQFVTFCFYELQLNRIEAEIHPDNKSSSKLLQKIGFQKEGYLRQRWSLNNIFSDSEIYGLVKQDITYPKDN